jgi:glycosyltransferase involved in cell wall biosynthesis
VLTPLRIAHVANEPFGAESTSGVQQAVYCLARAQAEMGHSVAVFSRDDNEVYVLADHAEGMLRGTTSRVAVPVRSLGERLLARYAEPERAEAVLGWAPTIVHFHSVHIPQNLALVPYLRHAGVPYCVTVHGALFDAAMQRGRVKKALFNWCFERRYLNEARFVHALSPHEADVIRRHGIDRPVVTVPNGTPPDAHVRPRQPDALYGEHPWLRGRQIFMFIGRLDPWQKGLDLLIEALAAARLRQAALVLVGPDCRGSRRDLASLADRHGVRSNVVFMEPAFGERKANLFAAAHVFVHTSRWEGSSLSVLAAAAAGKACLVTPEADPLGELRRARAAIVVEPIVASIAAGLTHASTLTPSELQLLGSRARQVVQDQFSWPASAGKLVDAYRGITRGSQRSKSSGETILMTDNGA